MDSCDPSAVDDTTSPMPDARGPQGLKVFTHTDAGYNIL